MATKVLQFSTAQVAGNLTTQLAGLACLTISGANLIADIAAVNQSIIDDRQITSPLLSVPNAAANQPGVIFTASSTKGATALTSFVLVSPTTASISSIVPGMRITGPGLAPDTVVKSAASTTININNATQSATTTQVFVATGPNLNGSYANGLLTVPNRGVLKVFPGDVVAWDIMGFPYLIPSTSVNLNGGGLNSGAPFLVT